MLGGFDMILQGEIGKQGNGWGEHNEGRDDKNKRELTHNRGTEALT